MTYFPLKEETAFTCPGCGKIYIPGNTSCCVIHPPGTCCHYGDTELPQQNKVEQEKEDVLTIT